MTSVRYILQRDCKSSWWQDMGRKRVGEELKILIIGYELIMRMLLKETIEELEDKRGGITYRRERGGRN